MVNSSNTVPKEKKEQRILKENFEMEYIYVSVHTYILSTGIWLLYTDYLHSSSSVTATSQPILL